MVQRPKETPQEMCLSGNSPPPWRAVVRAAEALDLESRQDPWRLVLWVDLAAQAETRCRAWCEGLCAVARGSGSRLQPPK